MQLWDACLIALVFFYSLNLAPMMFESFTSDRTWASNPPDSFHMFLGQYGQKTAHYWRVVAPVASLSFVLSLVVSWQVPDRRLWLSIAFVLYVAVHAATRWIFLNYFRNAAGVLAFVALMLAVLV